MTLLHARVLDWTIVRPSAFVESIACKMTPKISRADLAKFLTRKLSENRYIGQAAGISH
ncbi:MAG: hypothetical protein ACPG61_16240 [Paracoccaceae bacterium]